MSKVPLSLQAGENSVVSDQEKLKEMGPVGPFASRARKNVSVPVAVKLTRDAPAVAPGSIPEVSLTVRVLVPLQPSSPENAVRVPGGVSSPVAFLNSSE